MKPKQSQDLDPEDQVEPNNGYAEFGKKARKPDEKIIEKLCGNEIKMLPEFFQNDTKMETKWFPKWSQRLQREESHAEINRTHPEALGSGTLVAFWRKNGAQGGPKGSQESTNISEKSVTNGVDFPVYF